jgi:hypothetical protein
MSSYFPSVHHRALPVYGLVYFVPFFKLDRSVLSMSAANPLASASYFQYFTLLPNIPLADSAAWATKVLNGLSAGEIL